jgi:ribulose-5-phosphate 4-epimerase/fuculose-1-phosphate aldolase
MSEPRSGIGVLDGAGVVARTFAWSGQPTGSRMRWFADGLRRAMLEHGYTEMGAPGPDVAVVLHFMEAASPKSYRRRAAPTFVVALAELETPPTDSLRTGYPLLVRGLANLSIMLSDAPDLTVADFVTLEQGTYSVSTDVGDDLDFFTAVFSRIEPLATSRLVIGNEFETDLPAELWDGDDTTRQITRAGEQLAALDLLPAAFPIEEILSPRDLRQVKLLYGIGGLSYGNVSVRQRSSGDEPQPRYWMSASGVDKSSLREIGRDILLVTGYDELRGVMQLSVPPGVEPRRVSVDAIEHWMIYREHPEVGAILHVHAWIEGTLSTEINYPCGTHELASAVADLVRAAPDPARAVVGQRNHGLTITGPSLDEIFDRIDGKVVRKVPMD